MTYQYNYHVQSRYCASNYEQDMKHTQIGHAILNITLALISKSHPPLISCKNHIIVQIP